MLAVYCCLFAWNTGEYRAPPEFGPGGEEQCKYHTRYNNNMVNDACKDVFRHLNADFHSSLPVVQAKQLDNSNYMKCRRIHKTNIDPALAQPRNDYSSFDGDLPEHLPDKQDRADQQFC